MLKTSIREQIKICINKRIFIIFFIGMLIFISVNYIFNSYQYYGMDIVSLYSPMKILTLSEGGTVLNVYFLQYYAFIVILPAGFSFLNDKICGEQLYLQYRLGRKVYYEGKVISTFLVTFFTFTIPFFIEMCLTRLAFPARAVGDPSNFNPYDEVYLEYVENYFFSGLYKYNIHLYVIVCILLFGIFSGILGVFALSISMIRMKYRALLFLPVYIVLVLFLSIGQVFFPADSAFNYYFFLSMFDCGPKNGWVCIGFSGILIIATIIILIWKSRKDYI